MEAFTTWQCFHVPAHMMLEFSMFSVIRNQQALFSKALSFLYVSEP